MCPKIHSILCGSKAKPEGKYRIDSKNRKVYLKASLDMFCCTAHRVEAEDFGTTLALDLTGEGARRQRKLWRMSRV